MSDEFQEIREVIDRYETLTTNCKDLVEIQKENEEKFNSQRKFLINYLEVRFRFCSGHAKIYEILSPLLSMLTIEKELRNIEHEQSTGGASVQVGQGTERGTQCRERLESYSNYRGRKNSSYRRDKNVK